MSSIFRLIHDILFQILVEILAEGRKRTTRCQHLQQKLRKQNCCHPQRRNFKKRRGFGFPRHNPMPSHSRELFSWSLIWGVEKLVSQCLFSCNFPCGKKVETRGKSLQCSVIWFVSFSSLFLWNCYELLQQEQQHPEQGGRCSKKVQARHQRWQCPPFLQWKI